MNEAVIAALDLLELNASYVVTAYTKWYFIDAIAMMTLGILFLSLSIYLFIKYNNSDKYKEAKLFIGVLSAIFGLSLFLNYLPTAIEAEARAIHGIIKDIRG